MTAPAALTCITTYAAIMAEVDKNPVAKAHLQHRGQHPTHTEQASAAVCMMLNMEAEQSRMFAAALSPSDQQKVLDLWTNASAFEKLGLDQQQANDLANAIVCKQLGTIDPVTKKPHVRRGHTVSFRLFKVAAAVRHIPMDTLRSHRKYFRRVESRSTKCRART
jgi:hypothetical protein